MINSGSTRFPDRIKWPQELAHNPEGRDEHGPRRWELFYPGVGGQLVGRPTHHPLGRNTGGNLLVPCVLERSQEVYMR